MAGNGKVPANLRKEFNYLRERAGASVEKMRDCPDLMALLGASTAEEAFEKLQHEVSRLMARRDGRALSNALGFTLVHPPDSTGHRKSTITQRREDFGQWDSAAKVGTESVKNYENLGIDQLYVKLVASEPSSNVVNLHPPSKAPLRSEDLRSTPASVSETPKWRVGLPLNARSLSDLMHADSDPDEKILGDRVYTIPGLLGSEEGSVYVLPPLDENEPVMLEARSVTIIVSCLDHDGVSIREIWDWPDGEDMVRMIERGWNPDRSMIQMPPKAIVCRAPFHTKLNDITYLLRSVYADRSRWHEDIREDVPPYEPFTAARFKDIRLPSVRDTRLELPGNIGYQHDLKFRPIESGHWYGVAWGLGLKEP